MSEQNKKLKKVSGKLNQLNAHTDKEKSAPAWLAWGLLLLSWLGFGIYIFII